MLRTASAIAASAMLALLISMPASAAQKVPVEITEFGPFATGMTVEKAKAAAPRAKLQGCDDIAEERKCLAVRAGVFNEPATIYAVLDESAKRIEKIVAQFDPYHTHRRAFRCIRLSEKVFALLVVVYGSGYKQSYDEDRRPLPAVAWDGIREGRLIFKTNCRTQDEGSPTISVLPFKNPDAPPAPQVADNSGAAKTTAAQTGSVSQDGGVSASTEPADTAGVFEPGVDTGLSIEIAEPKPDIAPRMPVSEAPLPLQPTTAELGPKTQPSKQNAAQPEPEAAPLQQAASQPEPEALPRAEPRQTPVPDATPPVPAADSAAVSEQVADTVARATPKPSSPAAVEANAAGTSPGPSPTPRPEHPMVPKTNTPPEPLSEVARANLHQQAKLRQQMARLSPSDAAHGDTEPSPVDAPEPFTYADDDETDNSSMAEQAAQRAPSQRVASVPSSAPVPVLPQTSTPRPAPAIDATDTADTADATATAVDLMMAVGKYSVRPISSTTASASEQPVKLAKASAARIEAPIQAPKTRPLATGGPVSLLPSRPNLGPAASAPQNTVQTPKLTLKGDATGSLIEIRALPGPSPVQTAATTPKPGDVGRPASATVADAARGALTGPAADTSTSTAAESTAETVTPPAEPVTPPAEPVSTEPDPRMQAWAKSIVPRVSSLRDTRVTFDRVEKAQPVAEVGPGPATKLADRSPPSEKTTQTSASPVAATPNVAAKSTPTPLTHVVVEGETLYSIARRYKADLKALMRINNIAPSNLIRWGQTLIIPGPDTKASPAKSKSGRDNTPDRIEDSKLTPSVRDRTALDSAATPRRTENDVDERLSLAAEAQSEPQSEPPSKATFEP